MYLIGATREELGGSELFNELGSAGGQVPTVQPDAAGRGYRLLHDAIRAGWVRSAHDCSDGGLAVTLSETAFAGDLGLQIDLGALSAAEGLPAAALLFSETPSRIVVTVSPRHQDAFEAAMGEVTCHGLGRVRDGDRLTITGANGELCVNAALAELKEAWQRTLREL